MKDYGPSLQRREEASDSEPAEPPSLLGDFPALIGLNLISLR
ncbi:MAG TPA: hypothetical protein VHZ55_01425 [Bryobacteraceae bacterium]|jgi:hypothetical protein|nr:hypothetical protein [Bryobacteraceae bacterium]